MLVHKQDYVYFSLESQLSDIIIKGKQPREHFTLKKFRVMLMMTRKSEIRAFNTVIGWRERSRKKKKGKL